MSKIQLGLDPENTSSGQFKDNELVLIKSAGGSLSLGQPLSLQCNCRKHVVVSLKIVTFTKLLPLAATRFLD